MADCEDGSATPLMNIAADQRSAQLMMGLAAIDADWQMPLVATMKCTEQPDRNVVLAIDVPEESAWSVFGPPAKEPPFYVCDSEAHSVGSLTIRGIAVDDQVVMFSDVELSVDIKNADVRPLVEANAARDLDGKWQHVLVNLGIPTEGGLYGSARFNRRTGETMGEGLVCPIVEFVPATSN